MVITFRINLDIFLFTMVHNIYIYNIHSRDIKVLTKLNYFLLFNCLQLNNGNPDEIRKFNCDHCQKKYKRSWHQARHSQMKHENSNASTATTTSSSATTPPTPEINGNIPNNNNNYQENFNNFQPSTMPQSTQLPLQQVPNQPSANQPIQTHELNLQHQAQSIIPPAVNNLWSNVNISPQQHYYSQQSGMTTAFQTTNDLSNNNQSPGPLQQHHTPVAIKGEFMNYGEPPYTQHIKYEQIQTAPATPPSIPNHYETWVSSYKSIILNAKKC